MTHQIWLLFICLVFFVRMCLLSINFVFVVQAFEFEFTFKFKFALFSIRFKVWWKMHQQTSTEIYKQKNINNLNTFRVFFSLPRLDWNIEMAKSTFSSNIQIHWNLDAEISIQFKWLLSLIERKLQWVCLYGAEQNEFNIHHFNLDFI